MQAWLGFILWLLLDSVLKLHCCFLISGWSVSNWCRYQLRAIEKMESALLQNPSARINHIASMVYVLHNKMHMDKNKSAAGASAQTSCKGRSFYIFSITSWQTSRQITGKFCLQISWWFRRAFWYLQYYSNCAGTNTGSCTSVADSIT